MGGKTALLFFALTFLPDAYQLLYSFFWFSVGDCLLPKMEKANPLPWLAVCVVLSLGEILTESPVWEYFRIPIILIGITALWSGYDSLVPRGFRLSRHPWTARMCSFTFFIYLFHEPTLNVVRKLLVIPFGHTSVGFALAYLLSPWAFMAVWIPVGTFLKRFLPRLYSVCVGGR